MSSSTDGSLASFRMLTTTDTGSLSINVLDGTSEFYRFLFLEKVSETVFNNIIISEPMKILQSKLNTMISHIINYQWYSYSIIDNTARLTAENIFSDVQIAIVINDEDEYVFIPL